jgi:CheY-like chemotaxis protein
LYSSFPFGNQSFKDFFTGILIPVEMNDQTQLRERCSLRIFLVENHRDTAEYLREYLERIGYQVVLGRNMEMTLKEFPEAKCNLLICDIGLPDGNGWELMQKLRSTGKFVALAMSGYATADDIERSKAAGYLHHLIKPFSPQVLEAVLEQIGEDLRSESENVCGHE